MRKLIFLLLLMVGQFPYIFAQNDLKFGLQTGATISTFTTEVSISNAIASTIPPINEFNFSSNFNAGFWFEKRFNPFLALRWEVERSPGGAKAFDILEEREKRYKFFYISTPLLFKITALQKKVLYHYRFSVKTQQALRANDEPLLTEAFSNLKSYYKFYGIFTAIVLGFYVLIFVFAGIGMMAM